MYKIATFSALTDFVLSDRIEKWFTEHRNIELISTSITYSPGDRRFHAFVTYRIRER